MPSVNTEVPPKETPVGVCDHCGQPFATTERLVLHKGLEHFQALTEQEQDAFIAARSEEADDLRMLRFKALGMLIIVYFGFLFLYAIVA